MLKKLSIACTLLALVVSASPMLAGDLSEEGFTVTQIQDFSTARRSAPRAAQAKTPTAKTPKGSGGLWYDSPEPSDNADDLSMTSTASNYSHDESGDTGALEALDSRPSNAAGADTGSSSAAAPRENYHDLETDEVSLAAALEPITIGLLIIGGMTGLVRRYWKKK